MSFLKSIKLARKFEQKLLKEGLGPDDVRLVGPEGGSAQHVNLRTQPVPAAVKDPYADIPAPQPEQPKTVVVPEQTIVGKVPADPRVSSVQAFLNSQMAYQITNDGRFGKETARALSDWGKSLGLTLNQNQLFQLALGKATIK